MPVAIIQEPNEGFDYGLEHCAFCASRTGFWNAANDVPVCPLCASVYQQSDVPTKAQWWESPQSKGVVSIQLRSPIIACRYYDLLLDETATRRHFVVTMEFIDRGVLSPSSGSSGPSSDHPDKNRITHFLNEEVCDEYERRMGIAHTRTE